MHLIRNVVVFMFLLPEYANTLGISGVALEGLFTVAGNGIYTLQQFCKICQFKFTLSNLSVVYCFFFYLCWQNMYFLVQNFYISVASISEIAIREKMNTMEQDTMG